MLCGRGGPHVADLGQLERRVLALLDERPIHQQVVDDAEHRHRRGAQGEPDGPGPLDHLGLLDQPLGRRVGHVVDAGGRDAGVDLGLGGPVVVEAAVPLQMIGVQVEDGGRMQRQGVRPVQLVTGELDGQHVVRLRVEDGLHHRSTDVAHRRGPQSGGAQHRLQHLGGGRLAVRPGDAQPGDVLRRPGSAARPAPPRSRSAPSARRPATSNGCAGLQPVVITRSAPGGKAALEPRPRRTVAPRVSSSRPCRRCARPTRRRRRHAAPRIPAVRRPPRSRRPRDRQTTVRGTVRGREPRRSWSRSARRPRRAS